MKENLTNRQAFIVAPPPAGWKEIPLAGLPKSTFRAFLFSLQMDGCVKYGRPLNACGKTAGVSVYKKEEGREKKENTAVLGSQVCAVRRCFLSNFLRRRSLGHVEGGRFPLFIQRTGVLQHKRSSLSSSTQTHGDKKNKVDRNCENRMLGGGGCCFAWQCVCVCVSHVLYMLRFKQRSANTASG